MKLERATWTTIDAQLVNERTRIVDSCGREKTVVAWLTQAWSGSVAGTSGSVAQTRVVAGIYEDGVLTPADTYFPSMKTTRLVIG